MNNEDNTNYRAVSSCENCEFIENTGKKFSCLYWPHDLPNDPWHVVCDRWSSMYEEGSDENS